MADSFASSALSIKRHFRSLLPGRVILDACDQAGHVFRNRRFDPVVTVHLFVLQILRGNTAMTHLRILLGVPVNAAAYCRARMRLPVAVCEKLLDYSALLVSPGRCSWLIGIGRVLLVDGTSSLLPDTRSVRTLFRQPANIKPRCGYPMARVLAVFDAFSGVVLRPLICSLYVHEGSSAWRVHPLLRKGDLLVGDRAFCSYVHLAMLQARSVHGLFRLQQRQKTDFRKGRKHGGKGRPKTRFVRKLGPLDQVVEYFKPQQKPRWMSRKQYDTLPQSLVLRELRYHLPARGQRTRVVTLLTTLLNPQLHPAESVTRLYGLRWQVETHFKQLKRTMPMNQIKSRTAQGVQKELLMCLITYNLIRRVIADAAERQKVEPKRISFIDALRWLAEAAEDAELILLAVIPQRPDRHEPRVKKYLNYRYPPMTKPRHIMMKRPYLYGGKVK